MTTIDLELSPTNNIHKDNKKSFLLKQYIFFDN